MQETVQDSRGNPQDAITPLVAGFGRPEINHPRFILKAAGDSVRANLEQLGDLTHLKILVLALRIVQCFPLDSKDMPEY